MRERRTARVLLIGPAGRLLLIRFDDLRPAGAHVFWATVGGGVEAGETVLEAAAREIFEETGKSGLDLGPVVWRHEHVLALGAGHMRLKEDYVLARCPDETVRTHNMEALERSLMREHRWWSLAEIASTDEILYPPGLAALLAPILAGDIPRAPLQLHQP